MASREFDPSAHFLNKESFSHGDVDRFSKKRDVFVTNIGLNVALADSMQSKYRYPS